MGEKRIAFGQVSPKMIELRMAWWVEKARLPTANRPGPS